MASSFLFTTTLLPARCIKPSFRNPYPRHDSSLTFAVGAGGGGNGWEVEESRWLREEQRWLREEQRWLREERRWVVEREALLAEIAALRARLQQAALGSTVQTVGTVAPMPALTEKADVREIVFEEVRAPDGKGDNLPQRTLRMGMEGADVRSMQEALQRLGFYSGEEDIEYSSFSTGTERAVKTWQASQGTTQDGIMTAHLLELLYVGKTANVPNEKDGVNGPAVSSVSEMAEIQQTIVKDAGDSVVGVSEHRVFLLGENRWEEPSRLARKDKPSAGSTHAGSTKKCLSCRGEGRVLCTECDGTGEPNIEPQFMEWIEEGTKCPYCEGLGYTICDVCEGTAVTAN